MMINQQYHNSSFSQRNYCSVCGDHGIRHLTRIQSQYLAFLSEVLIGIETITSSFQSLTMLIRVIFFEH